MLPCALQHLSPIGKMHCEVSKLNYHIINTDFHQLANELMKYKIHSPLKSSTSILQAEGHDYPFKQSNMTRTSKCSLWNILFSHEYLIVSCIAIHKFDNPMPSRDIN